MTTTASAPSRKPDLHFSDLPKPTHTVSHDHLPAYAHQHQADHPPGYHAPRHTSTEPVPLTHSHSHSHIATPHPLSAALGYLDHHVPSFNKHHKEYTVQHDFRRAKKDARKSVDSPIPEMVEEPNTMTEEEEKRLFEIEERARREAEEQARKDKEAWDEVVKEREAARRRSGAHWSHHDRD